MAQERSAIIFISLAGRGKHRSMYHIQGEGSPFQSGENMCFILRPTFWALSTLSTQLLPHPERMDRSPNPSDPISYLQSRDVHSHLQELFEGSGMRTVV